MSGRLVPCNEPRKAKRVHLLGIDDDPVNMAPLLGMIGNWAAFLQQETTAGETALFRLHGRTGRPLGSEELITRREKMTGWRLRREKPGPKNMHKSKDN